MLKNCYKVFNNGFFLQWGQSSGVSGMRTIILPLYGLPGSVVATSTDVDDTAVTACAVYNFQWGSFQLYEPYTHILFWIAICF